ncbi:DUF58 domain-containing protein [Candidatus Woesearchaeota archaeon]|nr:DUF58 domain-containing protein [Candidatus Woesearchaeota archaeon]
MINTQFLDQLKRFNLVINKRVTSNLAGPRKSIAAGRGLTFKDYRIYAPGDDIRLIDWKVYARTDNLYLKVHEEERNLVVHLILDKSASMDFGRPVSKFDYASMIGVGTAYLAMRDNEKFQFATFADTLEIFQVNIEEIREAFYLLGDHEIKIVQVLDRVEKELKMEGDMKLKDSETGGILRTFVSPRMRMEYQQQLDAHCAKIEEVCNKLNIDYHLAVTDVSIFDTFYKILEG